MHPPRLIQYNTAALIILLAGLTVFGTVVTVMAAETATVSGMVTLAGPRPARQHIQLTEKDGKPSDCHELHKNGLLDETLIVGDQGQLANVFVYVKKGLPPGNYPAPEKAAVLDQDQCMFRPRVQGVLVGQDLLMRNSDPLVHNVRSLSIKNRAFNIAQPAETPDRKKVFTKREKAITIQCDFHPWMKAYVFVMDHPHFAVSDANGRFTIEGLPAGEYTLAAWHEESGEQELNVAVVAGGSAEVAFAFSEKKRGTIADNASPAPGTRSGDAASAKDLPKRRFVKMWKPEDLADDVVNLANRSPERGRELFAEASCIKCHVIAGKGTQFGPDLTDVAKRFKGPKLLEQVLKPSSEIHKEFQTHAFATADGRTVVGLVIKEDAESIHVLPNPLKPDEVTVIAAADIDERFTSQLSTMPEGLLMTFEKEEILDLLAFLEASTAMVDWPGWMGPNRDGWVSGFQPPTTWPDELNREWQVEVGTGYGSPLVAGDRVFQHARQGEDEVIWCFDLETGKIQWRQSYAAPFTIGNGAQRHGKGPKSTPVLADGRVFTMSITGVLSAWDAATGKRLWHRDYDGRFKKSHPYWGAATSPIVDGGRVIVHFGTDKQGALVALDVESGDEVWSYGDDGPSYSSPLLVEIHGVRQVVEWNHRALVGVESDSGRPLWEYPFPHVGSDQNMPTPAFCNGRVLLGGENRGMHSFEPQRNDGVWTVERRWHQDKVALDMSSAVINGDLLYGFSHYGSGRFFCLDPADGKIRWQGPGRTGDNVMFLSIPGHIVALIDDGQLQIIAARGDRFETVATYRVSESSTWAPPVMLDGGLLVKDSETLTRWSLPPQPAN